MRHPNIMNVYEATSTTQSHGDQYSLQRKQLGALTQAKKLGCSWVELAPGKRAWPMHYHLINEEAIFVLEGEGTLRLGSERYSIKAGDYISLRCDQEGAHQMINTSSAPLRYLCFSTMEPNEIAVYPDTNKMFVCAGSAPGGSKEQRTLTKVFYPNEVDYWEGE